MESPANNHIEKSEMNDANMYEEEAEKQRLKEI